MTTLLTLSLIACISTLIGAFVHRGGLASALEMVVVTAGSWTVGKIAMTVGAWVFA